MDDNHVSEEYKTALLDLTFNSKPLINLLTMLAEENVNHGMDIVKVICDRIKQVEVDQKLTSLYLLDSILKNIGGDYVHYISRSIVDIFCHVFESATDERKRMSLFKLRNTWTQYMPGKVLYDLDVRSNKTDPNWPVNRPSENSGSISQQKKIHINPKFLQKNDKVNTSNKQSAVSERNGLDKTAPKNPKDRLNEEEQRVQEQLKALQAEKVRRDREQHELMLRQKQIEREKMLSEQKRQLELLRKQQQSMTNNSNNKFPKQHPLHVNTQSNNQSTKREPTKDPRLRVTPSSSQEISTGKWGEKVTSPSFSSAKVSPKPIHKKKKGAVSVMNKIMTNLSAKKGKPVNSQEKAKSLQESTGNYNTKEIDTSTKSKKSPDLTKDKPTSEKQSLKSTKEFPTISHKQVNIVSSKSDSLLTATTQLSATSATTSTAVSNISSHNTATSTTPPLPFSAAFSGLSSRDMQIAAQAAAIATAMHQMQAVTQGAMAPEQSAQLAAQFIQIMQGASSLVATTQTSTATSSETTATNTVTTVSQQSAANTVSATVTTKAATTTSATTVRTSSETSKVKETKSKSDSNENTTKAATTHYKKDNTINESENIEQTKQPIKNKNNIEKIEVKKERNGRDKIKTKTENKKEESVRDRSPHNSRHKKTNEMKKENKSHNQESENSQLKSTKSKVRDRDLNKKESEKLEPPSKKLKDAPTDPNERPRKARARSPSRYYCRIERKMETEKRVEEKEKELKLHRNRKDSGSDEIGSKKQDVNSDKSKIYQQYVNHIAELEKRHAKPNSTINLATLDSVFKQIQSKFKAGLLSIDENKKLMNKLDMFATQLAGEEVRMIDRALGIQPTKPTKKRNENHPIKNAVKRDVNSPLPREDNAQKDNSVNSKNDPRLRRSAHPDEPRDGPPLHMQDSPPQHIRDGPPQHIRDGPPPHMRDGPPPYMRDGPPPHMRDGPPPHMRDDPPPHMRDGPPPHMRDGPPHHRRDGPPPHMRDSLHMRDGPPRFMRDGPPSYMRGGPPPFTRNGPLRHGPPTRMRDGPPPHMRDGFHPHMRDGPMPPHMRDGPPIRMRNAPPPHMRDGPLPPHMRDGPQHMMDGPPPQHMIDGPTEAHMMDDLPPQHMIDGPPLHIEDEFPPNMREGPIPHHMRDSSHHNFVDGPPGPWMGEGIPPHAQQPMRNTPPPPHMLENNESPVGFIPHSDGFNENSNGPFFASGPSLDVNNLLGQLMAVGMINTEIDATVPEMSLRIDCLKKRHQSVVQQLFLGSQCSSCGERFPDSHKKQYDDHLDWHFRENRREKDGVRKVVSRSWYHNLDDWIEHSEVKLREDGKVQSEFFESGKSDKPADEDNSRQFVFNDKKNEPEEEKSVPVSGDEGHGLCGVCMDPLMQYWDEELEEWRFKNSLREGTRTYHIDCFKDYVPYDAEDATTPRTPVDEPPSFVLDETAHAEGTSETTIETEEKSVVSTTIKTEETAPETVTTETKIETKEMESALDTKIESSEIEMDTNETSDIPSVPSEETTNVAETNAEESCKDDVIPMADDVISITIKTKEVDEEFPKIELNDGDLDDGQTKETSLDDEYMDKVDSPEYPLITNTSVETSPIVTMETDNKNITDQLTNTQSFEC